MVWYGMVWYGMVWYGMAWYGMVWHGMVWYGMPPRNSSGAKCTILYRSSTGMLQDARVVRER